MILPLVSKGCYRVIQNLDLGVTDQSVTGGCDGTFAFFLPDYTQRLYICIVFRGCGLLEYSACLPLKLKDCHSYVV